MQDIYLELDEFLRSVKISKNDTFALLLGAGASISSGVQSAQDCIWEWKKDIYVSKHIDCSDWIENYKIDQVKTAIQKWLDSEGTYLPLDHPDEYSTYIEKCYPIEDDRRKYFQSICEKKEPSIGYKLLCLLSEAGLFQSVWTTNFDSLTLKAANIANITAIDITLDCVDRIFRPMNHAELLHISLHGDYRHSRLKNTSKELQKQDETFLGKFIEYINDKHLLVIGYSGRDKSLMDALKQSYSRKGSGRLYWCGYDRNICENVQQLLELSKENGRQAFFIPTDGFDKLMVGISKACLKDNEQLYSKMNTYFCENSQSNSNTPFSIDIPHINAIIKSNEFPLALPQEVFQFEILYNEGEERWDTVRSLTRPYNIAAIPYKQSVWALGTITEIQQCFGKRIKEKISRKPVTDINIHKDSALYNLFVSAVTRALAQNSNQLTNGKDLIWRDEAIKEGVFGEKAYTIHKAVRISMKFDGDYYITLSPDFHINFNKEEDNEQLREIKKNIGREYFEKIWNKKYNDYINEWRELLLNINKTDKITKLEYPRNSGSGFYFEIRKVPAFAKIMQSQSVKGVTLNPKFPIKSIKYQGIQYQEPLLIFSLRNKNSSAIPKDFHPMRGLINNRPYDYPLTGGILDDEIKLGVICPKAESSLFSTFINEHQNKITSTVNPDYLIDYPGFFNVYGISLNIPMLSSDDWAICNEPTENTSLEETALNLARNIRERIEYLTRDGQSKVIIIFIPERWSNIIDFDTESEHFDLHDYIKAFCAERGVATQFIQEKTLRSPSNMKCQINWWLSLSYYVKSLRTPWILDSLDNDTAFAGIGYSVSHKSETNKIVLGCSHIYNSEGQGLRYKLSKVEDGIYWDKQKKPHLSYNDAFQFGLTVKELFYSAMNSLPKRVVVHKRTYFTPDEIKGIRDSLIGNGIEKIDLIEINFEDDIRFIASKISQEGMVNEADSFAVQRGTCMLLNPYNALLWTHGVVPSVRGEKLRYYLGGRYIPTPLRIRKHYGDSNIGQISSEILGLTKMNWNTFDLYTQLPATVYSSNEIARIGRLLSKREGATYDYRYFI
jgi:NAD-dependent SIR2 family protein deacetylase